MRHNERLCRRIVVKYEIRERWFSMRHNERLCRRMVVKYETQREIM